MNINKFIRKNIMILVLMVTSGQWSSFATSFTQFKTLYHKFIAKNSIFFLLQNFFDQKTNNN